MTGPTRPPPGRWDRSAVRGHPDLDPAPPATPRAPSQDFLLSMQRAAGNAAAARLVGDDPLPTVMRAPPGLGGGSTDILPTPRIATWSSDKFEISFSREGGTLNPRLDVTIRYLGSNTTLGRGTANASVSIGQKPLNLEVRSVDASGISVDLYGDGTKVLRVRDDARMSELPGGPGRSHVFNAWLDQRNLSSSSLTVFDPKASPADLTVAAPSRTPGRTPSSRGSGSALTAGGSCSTVTATRTRSWPSPSNTPRTAPTDRSPSSASNAPRR